MAELSVHDELCNAGWVVVPECLWDLSGAVVLHVVILEVSVAYGVLPVFGGDGAMLLSR